MAEKKRFIEMDYGEWQEAIIQMAMDLSDLNELETGTLRRMYRDLYGVDDDIDCSHTYAEIVEWADNNGKGIIEEKDIFAIIRDIENKSDANFSHWDNVEFAYDRVMARKEQ